MVDVDAGCFTVGVFQDAAWAEKGLNALKQAGFSGESLTILGKEGAVLAGLIERTFGSAGDRLDVAAVGTVLARGPLVGALQGTGGGLSTLGLSGAMRRVGYLPHDARIFEALTLRGGVMVAVRSEPRAADALAIFLSYGGGNAAIGAWGGRV